MTPLYGYIGRFWKGIGGSRSLAETLECIECAPVGAGLGQGGDRYVAGTDGVDVHGQVIAGLRHGRTDLDVHVVSQRLEAIREIHAALASQTNAARRAGGRGEVDVVQSAFLEELVILQEGPSAVELPRGEPGQGIRVGGEGNALVTESSPLEDGADRTRIDDIVAEIESAIDPRDHEVVGFMQPENTETHAVGGGGVHGKRRYVGGDGDLLHLACAGEINGLAHAALLHLGGDAGDFPQRPRPANEHGQSRRHDAVVVGHENLHITATPYCLP